MARKQPRQRQITMVAREFTKLGDLNLAKEVGWGKIPTYYYDFRRHRLPLTDDELDANFGPNIPVFTEDSTNPDRQTNAATGDGVNEPFAAMGVGIIAMGEGEAFAINGASVAAPAAEEQTPAIQQIMGATAECYCGAVDLTNAAETTRMATLWWGAPSWRFIEKFFQAYRLQVILGHRFQVVDESLFDVGMTPTPPEFIGASDSRIPTGPFIRATNDVMASKGLDTRFLPANFSSDGETSLCLPPPLAGVTYGHPRIIGLANRIYCFNSPILFLPGMRFEVEFYNNDDVAVFEALRNTVTANCTTADALFTETTELGGPCGINCTVPGGQINLGVVFKGFALWPSACVQYASEYLVPNSGMAALYHNNLGALTPWFHRADVSNDQLKMAAQNLGLPNYEQLKVAKGD